MNKILERAIAEVTRLPEDKQEAIACLMLEEIEAERLPEAVTTRAKAAYTLWSADPSHPGLHFKPVPSAGEGVWPVRIGIHWRAEATLLPLWGKSTVAPCQFHPHQIQKSQKPLGSYKNCFP